MKMENKCLIQNRGNTKISPLQGFVFIHGRLCYNNARKFHPFRVLFLFMAGCATIPSGLKSDCDER